MSEENEQSNEYDESLEPLYDPGFNWQSKRGRALKKALKVRWGTTRGKSRRTRSKRRKSYHPKVKTTRRRPSRARTTITRVIRKVVSRPRRTRRRKYDLPLAGQTGYIGAGVRHGLAMSGGIIHNRAITSSFSNINFPFIGRLRDIIKIGDTAITKLGIAMGAVGTFWEGSGMPYGAVVNTVCSGGVTESFTAPLLEGTVKAGVAMGGGGAGLPSESYIPMDTLGP